MKKILFISIIFLTSINLYSQDVQAFRYQIELDKWYFLIGDIDSTRAKQEYDNRIKEFPKHLVYIFSENARLEIYWLNDTLVSHMLLFQEDNSKYFYIDSEGNLTKKKVYSPVEYVVTSNEKESYVEVSEPIRGTTVFYLEHSKCSKLEVPIVNLNDEFYEYFQKFKCAPSVIQTELKSMTYRLSYEIKLNQPTAALAIEYLLKPKTKLNIELIEKIKTCANKVYNQ